ncbi:hypothetical protein C471_04910 [Halorubrum saccharovorum DSM 1137]|uniref:SipW-cognate class signal peptide n=1 Tax=Halorubrum saccharovorum DSM 1137 TaxID=1227484 RepID=M0E3I7_9EURY|nr:hypothetical protein [Halorubrum saccharovorum]ELZ42351.1 hypothetical protein C471_04910 [Halorubrum saccharovorum DSM 1137]
MQEPDLTRRQVLAGITVTGGAGALTGKGTMAVFSDEETFTGNSITGAASTAGAGVVELEVSASSSGDGDRLVYTIDVPDLVNNNPSYVWARPATCPEPIDAAADVYVELRAECGDDDSALIAEGTLKSVVNKLREDNGEPLRCQEGDDARCFRPGESVDFVLDVTGSNTNEEFAFEFEFYAEQCRYNTGTDTPFGPLSPCEPTNETGGKAISFIAFCSESGTLTPQVTDINSTDDDGPTSVDWETDGDVDYVVAKSGQNFTVYDYRDDSATRGTVTTGGDENADFYGAVSGSVEDGFEPAEGDSSGDANNGGANGLSGQSNEKSGKGGNSASSAPGELSADLVSQDDFPDSGTSIKLEETDNTFEEKQ